MLLNSLIVLAQLSQPKASMPGRKRNTSQPTSDLAGAPLCLDSRATRRIGFTARDHNLQSLHGKHLPQSNAAPIEDINAPPQDSSDEEIAEEVPEAEHEADVASSDLSSPSFGYGSSALADRTGNVEDDFSTSWHSQRSKPVVRKANWTNRTNRSRTTKNIHAKANSPKDASKTVPKNGSDSTAKSKFKKPEQASLLESKPGLRQPSFNKPPLPTSAQPDREEPDPHYTKPTFKSPAGVEKAQTTKASNDPSRPNQLLRSAANKLDIHDIPQLQAIPSSGSTDHPSGKSDYGDSFASDEFNELHWDEISHILSAQEKQPGQEHAEQSALRRESRCPLCKEPVDSDWLREAASSERLTLRQQSEICRAHKAKSAQDQWLQIGYPQIQWEEFGTRINGYFESLSQMLNSQQLGTAPPERQFYRNSLEDLLASGKARTLKQALAQGGQTLDSLTPGYYGPKGARIMVESLVAEFGAQLRRMAGSDKVINAVGVSGYVQAVLVPELAVMLIQDDMGVNMDAARQVLAESIEVGHLLNEEDDDEELMNMNEDDASP